jgi:hypothetical protein
MNSFPFKTLFFCIFLPPICYILTLQILESSLQKREIAFLEKAIIQDQEALFAGRHSVVEEIRQNLRTYLAQGMRYRLGIRTNILIKTGDDQILYPVPDGNQGTSQGLDFADPTEEALNYVEVAAENYRILNEGLSVSVDLRIAHNSWISNSILIFYVFISVSVLSAFVKKSLRTSEKEAAEQQRLIKLFSHQLTQTEKRLQSVRTKESEFHVRIEKLNQEKKGLSEDVNGLLSEMEELETGLESQKRLKEELELEVLKLEEELDKFKTKTEKPKKKRKKVEAIAKRFSVLYKNLSFTDRAVEGFFSLTDDFQLKAEEVIHRLNANEDKVDVKRKVFGKGGKMNVLELDFAYSGRIYYNRDSASKTKVIAIGTKNTQEKDMAYLESYEKTPQTM